MASEICVPMKVKDWPLPDSVTIDLPPAPNQAGMKPLPTLSLSGVPISVIEQMADRWLDQLFAGLGKPSPFRFRAQDRAA